MKYRAIKVVTVHYPTGQLNWSTVKFSINLRHRFSQNALEVYLRVGQKSLEFVVGIL